MEDSTQDKKEGNKPKPPRLSGKNKEIWKGGNKTATDVLEKLSLCLNILKNWQEMAISAPKTVFLPQYDKKDTTHQLALLNIIKLYSVYGLAAKMSEELNQLCTYMKRNALFGEENEQTETLKQLCKIVEDNDELIQKIIADETNGLFRFDAIFPSFLFNDFQVLQFDRYSWSYKDIRGTLVPSGFDDKLCIDFAQGVFPQKSNVVISY